MLAAIRHEAGLGYLNSESGLLTDASMHSIGAFLNWLGNLSFVFKLLVSVFAFAAVTLITRYGKLWRPFLFYSDRRGTAADSGWTFIRVAVFRVTTIVTSRALGIFVELFDRLWRLG